MSNALWGWLLLVAAGCMEVVWPIGIKQAQHVAGTARWCWVAITIAALALSIALLAVAVGKRFGVPIGTAYAVWTGIGTSGAALVGIALFHEPSHWPRLACIGLILMGVVGLKITYREAATLGPPAALDTLKGGWSASPRASASGAAPGYPDAGGQRPADRMGRASPDAPADGGSSPSSSDRSL